MWLAVLCTALRSLSGLPRFDSSVFLRLGKKLVVVDKVLWGRGGEGGGGICLWGHPSCLARSACTPQTLNQARGHDPTDVCGIPFAHRSSRGGRPLLLGRSIGTSSEWGKDTHKT